MGESLRYSLFLLGNLEVCSDGGPGTKVEMRLKRNDTGTSATDTACKQHDIDYSNIKTSLKSGRISKEEAEKRVRASDNKLLNASARSLLTDHSPLNALHATATQTGIRLKKLGEDVGIIDKTHYLGKGKGKDQDPAAKLRMLAKHSKVINVGGQYTIPNTKPVKLKAGGELEVDKEALKKVLETFPKDVIEKMISLQRSGGLNGIINRAIIKLQPRLPVKW